MKIRKIVSVRRVDIVHANSLWTLNFAVAALWNKKIPVVCSTHAYPRIHSRLKSFLFFLIKKFISSHTKEFYVVSDSLKTEMIRSGFPHDKLKKIENGVDFELFNTHIEGTDIKSNEKIPENALVVGIVGRIHPGKGQGIFVDAARKVHLKHPDIHFLIVGAEYITPLENLDFKSTLKKKIAEYKLEKNFHFIGIQKNIENVIAAMDIITLPSKEETFGLSILEGMAEGKAVIASNTGGLTELVEHGKTGLLVPPENPEALADAIISLAESHKMRRELGQNAAKHVSERYSLEKFMGKTIKRYMYLISSG